MIRSGFLQQREWRLIKPTLAARNRSLWKERLDKTQIKRRKVLLYTTQRRIQNTSQHLRHNFLQKQSTSESYLLFLQKAPP